MSQHRIESSTPLGQTPGCGKFPNCCGTIISRPCAAASLYKRAGSQQPANFGSLIALEKNFAHYLRTKRYRFMTSAPNLSSNTYKPALDGLRAISILFVLYGHLSMEHALPRSISATPLGLGGVVIFFAISGFLITSQLMSELTKSGSIRLRYFYLRRGFRLFPALILFIG